MVVTVAEYRARVRKVVEAPSGASFEVRKLKQQDFVPKGLVALTIETMKEVPEEVAREYLKNHPDEVLAIEEVVLVKGVVAPRLTVIGDDSKGLHVDELEEADRKFLFDTITDFSGMTEAAMAAVDNFRRQNVDGARSDVPVLQDAPVGAAGPAD
jgi:hypothetical protein